MRENETVTIPERNPQTQAAHRREVLWQITVPFILGIILFLVVAVLASLSGPAPARLWGEVALIWLILPMFVVLLILIGITGGLVYLLIRLNLALPGLAFKTQNLVRAVQEKITAVADQMVKPVFKIEGMRASVKSIFGRWHT
jgi:cobalamin biosynthesis protein CobD/CbiB